MRTRALTVTAITLLAGGATAIAGPIGFVGLMVPHVARWIVGPDQRWIFAYSVLLGPSLLLASDILGRVVMHPARSRSGIVTAFVGAPVLIALVRVERQHAVTARRGLDHAHSLRGDSTAGDGRVDFGRRVLVLRRTRVSVRVELRASWSARRSRW